MMSNPERDSGLHKLGEVMATATGLEHSGELCALGTAAICELTGASGAMMWAGARTPPGPRHAHVRGVQAELTGSEHCPELVAETLWQQGAMLQRNVPRARLGLSAGMALLSVQSVTGRAAGELSCWLGVLASAEQPELTQHQRSLLQILATHLSVVLASMVREQERRSAERKYRTLVEQLPAATYQRPMNAPGKASYMSPQCEAILGYEPEEIIGDPTFFERHVHPEDLPWVSSFQQTALRTNIAKPTTVSYRMLHKDGHVVWVLNHVLAVHDDEGKPQSALGVIFDVTKTKLLEEQLRHAQKMEAVGRLAGGIAHDFNNLLAVIVGYGSFIDRKLASTDPHSRYLAEVLAAAERGKMLVQQLLAFSRRQVVNPKVINLRMVLEGMRSMIERLLSDDIELTFSAAADLGSTLIDRGQLEQVIMNLLVNACDAMPQGGRLTLSGSNASLDEAFASTHHNVTPAIM